ncbi:hypothetical protein CLV24_12440 [Pontibacter ummariensis]|uniref:DUF389 domain-containing protein n=1 Tax=Pontibacter ummariensis TaxID=1610492 RepID=A0A239JW58_9BACT|nr:hypothetical protein [Pontibacter ummariensis]PRY07302.1 hypothetical protein CLV24_12440 [Pontibacter ummariensis]SNT10101.1 hypothetical protein SAMN06296052_12424 [Pontibacter ummariensis]
MRIITVKAPEGQGKNVANLAFAAGASQVSVRQEIRYTTDHQEKKLDVVQVETATPKVKTLVERLMTAPFYDPDLFAFTTQHPESLFAAAAPIEETDPTVRPTTDVYEELWQYTKVTGSLVSRVFLSSVLLAYGMVEDMIPLIIAGLLFLPYHHHMLGVGLGAVIREWRFLGQGLLALFVSTALIVLAGVCVAYFTKPPIGWHDLGSPLSGFIISCVIGAAAGLGAVDDAGRRELVGLAATAHISVYPAWFGLKLVFGFDEHAKWQDHLLAFGINVTTLTVVAGITFAIMGMRGEGIRRFLKAKTGEK